MYHKLRIPEEIFVDLANIGPVAGIKLAPEV